MFIFLDWNILEMTCLETWYMQLVACLAFVNKQIKSIQKIYDSKEERIVYFKAQ
jgi:hypothetical protein